MKDTGTKVGMDPHIWLSVSGARRQAHNILKALTEIDPRTPPIIRRTMTVSLFCLIRPTSKSKGY
ncbi:MAG: hypothetical protein IPN08_13975 [Bacteroidales bacterium]|nr:hypothetical protein [Bacteroidales bacterium]